MTEKKYYHVYGYRTANKANIPSHVQANGVPLGEVSGESTSSAMSNAKKKFSEFTIKKVSLKAEYR